MTDDRHEPTGDDETEVPSDAAATRPARPSELSPGDEDPQRDEAAERARAAVEPGRERE